MSSPSTFVSTAVAADLQEALATGRRSRPVSRDRGGRLRGLVCGLVFIVTRVPVYAAVVLFAAAAGIAGLALFAVRAVLIRLSGDGAGSEVDYGRGAAGGGHG
jgi:hypothetical protein